jgi:hypothetical protein
VRHWTLDEASAELPAVRPIVARVRELVPVVREHQGESDPTRNGVSTNGHGPRAGTDTEATLRALLTDLDERGIIVRDPERGLIDFPAQSASGETYLLCWLDGEDAIEWWHWPDAGFAGRTPISAPPS